MKKVPQFLHAKFSPSIHPINLNSKMYVGNVMHFRSEGVSL